MAYIFYNSKYTGSGWAILYYNTSSKTYQIWADSRKGGLTLIFEHKHKAEAVKFREGLSSSR